jgi:hypothetical protein
MADQFFIYNSGSALVITILDVLIYNRSYLMSLYKSAIWPVIEKELMPWVNDHRQQELSVSSTELRLKALSVSKTMPNTKASFGYDLSVFSRT